jgi:hypothetical protein
MAATDSPDSTTTTRETAGPEAMSGARFERPGTVAETPAAATSSGSSTAAIVLGIIGILGGLFIPLIGLVLGIIGLVVDKSARRAGAGKAGMYLCIAAIVVSVANWIATAIIVAS